MRLTLLLLLSLVTYAASAQSQPVFHLQYKLNFFKYKKKTYTCPDTTITVDVTTRSEIIPIGTNAEIAVQFDFLESHTNTPGYVLRVVHYIRQGDHWKPIRVVSKLIFDIGPNYDPGAPAIKWPHSFRKKRPNIYVDFMVEILRK